MPKTPAKCSPKRKRDPKPRAQRRTKARKVSTPAAIAAAAAWRQRLSQNACTVSLDSCARLLGKEKIQSLLHGEAAAAERRINLKLAIDADRAFSVNYANKRKKKFRKKELKSPSTAPVYLPTA